MQQFHDLYDHILRYGQAVDDDRTGVGTFSVFGYQMRFHLQDGFPLLGTKFTPFKSVLTELLWFLKGNPDISYLHQHKNHIWDEWVKEDGTFGPIYGSQWRSWPGRCVGRSSDDDENKLRLASIDQIQDAIELLRTNPSSRRNLVSAWNVADQRSGEMALDPCHVLFQFYSRRIPGTNQRGLSCQMYQRSCDSFLGVPFNVASYALLTHMIARVTNHVPDEFIWVGGDVHLYKNHISQVKQFLARDPNAFPLPRLEILKNTQNIDDFDVEDFRVTGYQHLGKIPAPVAV